MTRLLRPDQITHDELVEWAYDPDPALPENANGNVWDLMLFEWSLDKGLFMGFVLDEACPKRGYFLAVIRESVRHASHVPMPSAADRAFEKRKGRGRKEKARLEARLQRSLHDEALARIREQVLSFLAAIPDGPIPPEVRELRRRLEVLLQDPSTISDSYWAPSPDYVL